MQGIPDRTAPETDVRPLEQEIGGADNTDTQIAQLNDLAPRTPLRVAVVGGGIGGLALATLLATSAFNATTSSDLEISIYEAAPSLTELGAGIGIWLRTWRILSSAGLEKDLKAIAPSGIDLTDRLQRSFEYRRGDRSPEGRSFYSMEVPFGTLTLHRADFQRVLSRHAIPPAQPYFGKRFSGYEYADEKDPSSEIILRFVDGSTARADLLVGADGIRSVVRRGVIDRLVQRGVLNINSRDPSAGISNNGVLSVTSDCVKPGSITNEVQADNGNSSKRGKIDGDERRGVDVISDLVEPVWSGTLVYRSLIPLEAVEARFPGHRAGRGPVMYFGKNQHITAYPISVGGGSVSNAEGFEVQTSTPTQMVNLVVCVSDPSLEGKQLPQGEVWVRPASREEVIGKFGGWEDEVIALLELAEKPLAWAIHTIKPLPYYSDADGRVVLLGDAAHAMTPYQGAGGGQAIEDAHVLAALLTHPLLTRATLPEALKVYDAVRVPASQRVVRNSRLTGMIYTLNHAWDDDAELSLTDAEELKRLRTLADTNMEILKWNWEDPGLPGSDSRDWDQARQAVRLFEDSLKE